MKTICWSIIEFSGGWVKVEIWDKKDVQRKNVITKTLVRTDDEIIRNVIQDEFGVKNFKVLRIKL